MSCVICQGSLLDRNTAEVKRKGIETLVKHSSRRADGLAEVFQNAESIVLHADCRTKYVYSKGKSRFKNFKPQNVSPSEPSPIQEFAFALVPNDDTEVYIPETTDDYASMHVLDIEDDTNIDTSIKTELTDNLLEVRENYGYKETSLTESEVMNDNDIEQKYQAKTKKYSFDETSLAQSESDVLNDIDMEQKYQTKTIESHLSTSPEHDNYDKSIESITELERIQAAESKLKSYLADQTKPFPYEHLCVICAKNASDRYISNRKKKSKTVRISMFRCKERQDTLINTLLKLSPTPPEFQAILQRIQGVDLTKMKARFHYLCLSMIKRGPAPTIKKESAESLLKPSMDMICRYIEQKNCRHYSVRELLDLTNIYSKGQSKGFNVKSIHRAFRKQLTAIYEDKIHFTNATGYNPVITMLRVPNWTFNDENDIFYEGSGPRKGNRPIKPKKNKEKRKKKEKEENNEAPSATEEDSKCGDVFDDGPHSPGEKIYEEQENLDNDGNENTRCDICLSANRKLNVLGEYADIYKRICGGDICPSVTDPFLLCWECRALLRNAQRLLKRVHLSQQILNGELQAQIKCLSSISITTPPSAHISYQPEQIKTEIDSEEKVEDYTNYEYLEHNTTEIDVKDNIPTLLEDDNKDDVTEFYSFHGFDDDDNDIDPPAAKRAKSSESTEAENDITDNGQSDDEMNQPKRSKRLQNKPNEDDGDEDPFPNRSKTRSLAKNISANVTKKLAKKKPTNYDFVIDDEKEEENEKSEDSENDKSEKKAKDSDWAESNIPPPSKYKRNPNNRLSRRIKYIKFCRVQTLKVHLKSSIKRIAIQPEEVSEWRGRERNSDYFVNCRTDRKCDKCMWKFIETNHYDLYHSESNPFLCEICETRFATQPELDSHLADHYFIYECAICQYRCYGPRHMRHHVLQHKIRHECILCGKEVSSIESFKEHYKELHQPKRECNYCGKIFQVEANLEKHLETHQSRLSCPSCKYTCIGLVKLQRHTASKHPVTKSENAYCVECDKQYANEKLLQKHLKKSIKHVEGPPRPPRVKPCRVLKPKQKMKFKCPECPKVYYKKQMMKEHYNFEHLKKIDFYCNICDKSFMFRNQYRRHTRAHEGYKDPKNKICNYCQRGFSSKVILENHIRTHTGEKPFACPHCDARFAQRIAMKMHVKHIHEGAPRKPAVL